MPASVRSVSSPAGETDASVIVTKPAGTSIGDILYGFHSQDDGTLASMATTGTFATLLSHDHASTALKLKVYRRVVDGSEGANFTFSSSGGYTCAGLVCVQDADTTTPEDVTPLISPSASSTASCVAPAISPIAADAFLLTAHTGEGAGGAPGSMTPPSGMTELFDLQAGSFPHMSVAGLGLSSSGSTGTKTATISFGAWNIGASIVVRSATAGTPIPPRRPQLVIPRLLTPSRW